jgi:hypothetical protein
MESGPLKFSTNKNSKSHQLKITQKAREIFRTTTKTLNTGKTLKIKSLSDLLKLFKTEWNIKDSTHEIILNFIFEKLKKNNKEDSITEDEFIDLLTGNIIRDILFEYNLDEKRKQIENITLLYKMMGGNDKGLSSDVLKSNMQQFMEFISDVDGFVDRETSLYEKKNFNSEVEDILNLLATGSKDYLTLEDFINIVSEETYTNFDNFAIDPI